MLADHVTISQSIGWWYPYGSICLLCDRPALLNLNAEGRLHSDTQPALSFRDGYSLWAINGMRVPRAIIESPETLTFEQVRDEPNAEIRRHMIDRFGGFRETDAQAAWIAAGNLKPVSEENITDRMQPPGLSIWRKSHGDAPVTCRLYRAELADDEPLSLLLVVCTSTAKETCLRVPPEIKTAKRAREWTFGVSLAGAFET